MLKNIHWPIDRVYKSNSENCPLKFYLQSLQNSKVFYLQLGYFNSTAINLLALGFANFISKGGKVHLIINHFLSENDKRLVNGEFLNNTLFDLDDPIKLAKQLSKPSIHFFECLSYLIKHDKLSFTVIKPKGGLGIAHYKSGLFYDGIDYVGYIGSCNFTLAGLTQNLEELRVDLDWDGETQLIRNKNKLDEIEEIIQKRNQNIDYLNPEKIIAVIQQCTNKNKDLKELLLDSNQLLDAQRTLEKNKTLNEEIKKLKAENLRIAFSPKFPYLSGPREYQVKAYNSWIQNNCQGVFAMATGTGKTITALNCVLEEYKKSGFYRALILVPTVSLINQWAKECKLFQYNNIIRVNVDSDWEQQILNSTSSLYGEEQSYIVIVTYASFQGKKFPQFMSLLAENTIFIADEAHNMGSPRIRTLLSKIPFNKRIGLSATPDRIYDHEGEAEYLKFFNDKYPYTYQYSMEKAIENGVLCSYYYFPKFVSLTSAEQEEYNKFSDRLSKLHYQIEGCKQSSLKRELEEQRKTLLLARKRIIHQAENKLPAFKDILKEIAVSDNGLKHTLVYAPEGSLEAEELSEVDNSENTDQNRRIIDQYTRLVSDFNKDISVKKFTAASQNRENILKNFSSGLTEILVSMKCLDEGVDIPQAKQAIFCASTGNPRQFIQRRGRILRKHPSKDFAIIYDLVVFPEIADSLSFDNEKRLILSELRRVAHFASLARNKLTIQKQLQPIFDKYNISFYELMNEGF